MQYLTGMPFNAKIWEPKVVCICHSQKPENVWVDTWGKCIKCSRQVIEKTVKTDG
jgi:hypothetical protein